MGALLKCKAEVTFQCPNWDKCNEMLYGGMQAGNNKCRFCVSRGKQTMCLLHDRHLSVNADGTVNKCIECRGKTTGWFSGKTTQVNLGSSDSSQPVDVQRIVKATADNMSKAVKNMIKNGYPPSAAIDAAHDLIIKGGW